MDRVVAGVDFERIRRAIADHQINGQIPEIGIFNRQGVAMNFEKIVVRVLRRINCQAQDKNAEKTQVNCAERSNSYVGKSVIARHSYGGRRCCGIPLKLGLHRCFLLV